MVVTNMIKIYVHDHQLWKPFWENFCNVVIQSNPYDQQFGADYHANQKHMLAEYRAEYHWAGPDDWLEFENQDDATFFLLKFS